MKRFLVKYVLGSSTTEIHEEVEVQDDEDAMDAYVKATVLIVRPIAWYEVTELPKLSPEERLLRDIFKRKPS